MLTHTDPNLQRSAPESQGIASSALLDFVTGLENRIHELHSFMLLRHGAVIAEGWWSPYQSDYPHMLFSVSKSFTATAVGLAMEEGFFSIDDTVLSFFPDEAPSEPGEFLQAMRVRHLLSMSTGHADDTLAYMETREDANWIKAFFGVPIRYEPGTHFMYNTGATYMLSAIVQKTTGMKLIDYLESRLFEPLGIENATWEESPQHINLGGIGLSIKTEDIARFGQLYLQKGIWRGEQILPQAWITEATRSQISNGDYADSDWTQGYGYQFWRCRHHAYRGDGIFGQYCIVMPEQDAVLAITGGTDDMQELLDIVWEKLLPAIGADSLAEDAESYDALKQKLACLVLPTIKGQVNSPIAAQVSGRMYKVDANELNIESVMVNFAESACTISIKTSTDEQVIPCGYGVWEKGQSSLFNDRWLHGSLPIVTGGMWTSEDRFAMHIRFYETPFYHSLVLHFLGDELLIETRINLSLESIKTILLTAHV